MKRQVVAIHGGTSFDTHEEYLEFLKTRELTLEKLRQGTVDWKASLPRELGDDWEVLLPKMPNGTNVRYLEWQIWFERVASFVRDDVVLIGHSLGGIFLVKYLAEHKFPKRITATILVAAPFDDGDIETGESLTEFRLPASLEGVAGQGGAIHLVYSSDDPVVPVAHVKKYEQALSDAQTTLFKDRGHFNQPDFPELVSLIQSL